MQRTTLKALSKALGLAEGTVSRALNGYKDINPATAARVRAAALEMNYKPNQMARRLAIGTPEAVAYMMPRSQSSLAEPFVSMLLEGLGQTLDRRGWDLLVSHSVSAEDEPDLIRRLITSGRVSGVVLSRPLKHDARITMLQSAGFPFVVHGRSLACEDYAWFDIDNERAFRQIIDHLVALGHRRVALVGAPLYYTFAQMRLDGFQAGLAAHGLEQDESLVVITDMSDDGGERAAGELLDSDRPPSAIVCMTDTQALGALAAVRARGKVPGIDVSVIGYDGLSVGRHTNPPLTSMAQPQTDSGRRLGDMLLAIIDGAPAANFQELRHAELLRRKSDGPCQSEVNAEASKTVNSKPTGTTGDQR